MSEIKINEDFHYLRIENDICLLELDEPLELNEYGNTYFYLPKVQKLTKHRYVGAVDLPEPFSPPPTPFATVSGWGSTEIGGPSSDLLRQVTIPIIPDEECREDYIDFGSVYETNLCAGEEGRDHCNVRRIFFLLCLLDP